MFACHSTNTAPAGSARRISAGFAVGLVLIQATSAWAQGGSAATSTGTSNKFNPAISLNGLFLFSAFPGMMQEEPGNEDEPPAEEEGPLGHLEEGISVQELEFRFTAHVDPYTRADATVAYHDGEFSIEEVYATGNFLPFGLGLRAGQYLVPISQENVLHTHMLPFIQRSLVGTSLFGEAYGDVGIQLSWLAPLPFYADARVAVLNGDNVTFFNAADGLDFAYYGGLTTLWDLSESSTFELEGDYMTGRNAYGESTFSTLGSASAVFHWRPLQTQRYKRVRLWGEYLFGDRPADDPALAFDQAGWYAYCEFQFARRWWIQGRYGQVHTVGGPELTQRVSAMLALVPTEFQALRFEYSYVTTPEQSFSEVFVQLNFTIGSHPAHVY